MAKKSTMSRHIDQALRYDRAMLDELVEVTAEWNELPDAELASWTLDWHQFAFDKMKQITEDYVNGHMNHEQEQEFRKLVKLIDEHRSLIQRFGLTMPQTPVET